MAPQLMTLFVGDLEAKDLPLFVRSSILRGDLASLQSIFNQFDGFPDFQDRIALAADALGNGFYGGNLGIDIDSRLNGAKTRSRAMRDAMIAHALGALLSDEAIKLIESNSKPIGRLGGDLFLLRSAAKKGAEAETALRAAIILEKNSSLTDYQAFLVIESLYVAGLRDQAAQLAALDFTGNLDATLRE